jgi:hypothetical protein
MADFQSRIWDCLIEQDGDTVAALLTKYHGMQLLNEGFLEYLIDEGYLEADEDEEEP